MSRLLVGWNDAVVADLSSKPDTKKLSKKFFLLVFLTIFACALLSLVGLAWVGLVLILCSSLGIFLKKSLARRKIFTAFDREYPTLLMLLGSSIRTGADPLSAFLSAADFFDGGSVMSKELGRVKDLITQGVREDDAIKTFGVESGHPDVSLLHGALILSRRHGSALAECLVRLVKVTRQRQSFRRKIRAALAMQRFSAIGISGLALMFCGMQLLTNKNALEQTFHHPVGFPLLCCGGACIALGMIWISLMGRRRI